MCLGTVGAYDVGRPLAVWATLMRCTRFRLLLVVAVVVLAVTAAACTTRADPLSLVVGVGSTDEQRVLAALTAAAVEQAGMAVEVVSGLGDTVGLRNAATEGVVDLYWDYTGAAWALALDLPQPPPDPQESYERVARADAQHGLVWLEPSTVNATLALFVPAGALPEPPDNTLTWLAGELSAGGRALCADADFLERAAGYGALAAEYAIETDRVQTIPAGEAKAVAWAAEGRCFAALATATSGAAVRNGLAAVVDDQRVFPAFIAAPVATEEAFGHHPRLAGALAAVTDRLSTPALARMNAQVLAGEDPEDLAAAFLRG